LQGPARSTVRTSYKVDGAAYNLYGVPAAGPGLKSEILIQSQEGFDRNVPPVRMSEDQFGQLMREIKASQEP
jgi:hypothetical protein